MYCKICSICGEISYSSGATGKWICPYCSADITLEAAVVAEEE
jgi:transposase